jgi:hypothetical protein
MRNDVRDEVGDDGGNEVGVYAADEVGGDSKVMNCGAGGDSAGGFGSSRARITGKLYFVGPPLELPPESQILIKPSVK